jgi:ferredoxin-NADP reductase
VPAGPPFRLLYGVTDPSRVYYADELAALAGSDVEVTLRYSRRVPDGSGLHAGRLNRDDLAALTFPAAMRPTVYVCGPTGFVEAVADSLLALGHDAARVRTERFGPTR